MECDNCTSSGEETYHVLTCADGPQYTLCGCCFSAAMLMNGREAIAHVEWEYDPDQDTYVYVLGEVGDDLVQAAVAADASTLNYGDEPPY